AKTVQQIEIAKRRPINVNDIVEESSALRDPSRGKVQQQTEVLVAKHSTALNAFDKLVRDSTGNWVVPGLRRLDPNDARPAYVESVIAFGGNRFDLTPAQQRAIDSIAADGGIYGALRTESEAFGIERELTTLAEGQRFNHRKVVEDKSRERVGTIGGRTLKRIKEFDRQFADPDVAIDKGIVYDHPLQAVEEFSEDILTDASNVHIIEMLKSTLGQTPQDRITKDLGGTLNALRRKVFGRRRTLQARTGTAKARAAEEKRLEREFREAANRLLVRDEALKILEDEAPDIAALGDLIRGAREAARDGRTLSRKLGAVGELLHSKKRSLSGAERKVLTRAEALAKQAEAFEKVLDDFPSTEGLLRTDAALPGEVAVSQRGSRTRRVAQRKILRQMQKIEREMDSITREAEGLDRRVESLLEQQDVLGTDDAVVRAAFDESLKDITASVKLNMKLRATELEVRAARLEEARGARRVTAGATRTQEQLDRVRATKAEIDALDADIKKVRAERDKIVAEAAVVPEGRRKLQGQVAPSLINVDFPEADVRTIQRWMDQGKIPDTQLGRITGKIRAANRFMVPLRATADLSSTFNQLAGFFVSNPVRFVKNFGRALRDGVNFRDYDAYLAENAQDAAAHGVAILGRGQRATSDFEFDNWFTRVPVLKQVLGPAQRHFQAFTTRMRVDVFNDLVGANAARGNTLDNLAKDELGKGLNRMSGIATSRAGDAETLLEFAPNFMRSGLETVWAGFTNGDIDGQIARQYMRNLTVFAVATAGTYAVATGRDPKEVLQPLNTSALARGEIRLNPNFLTIRVPGIDQDVSLMGRFDSLARLVVLAGDVGRGVISEQSVAPLVEGIDFLARSKGSPVLSTAWNLVTGTTFTGEDPLSPSGLASELLPFSFSSFVGDSEAGFPVAIGGALVNSLGAKSNPITPFEQLQAAAQSVFNKPLDTLTGQERDELEAAFPTIASRFRTQNERFARSGDEKAKARIENDEIDADRQEEERNLVLTLQSGEISNRQFSERLDELQRDSAILKQKVFAVLDVDFLGPRSAPGKALEAWYRTYDNAKVGGTDIIDFELRDELEASLFTRIDTGEFGDPATARRFIEERGRPAHDDPAVQRYFLAKDVLSKSTYYTLRDAIFDRFGRAATAIDPAIDSYGKLVLAVDIAGRTGDTARARRLGRVLNRINSETTRQRDRLIRQQPQLAEALVVTGRRSPTSPAVRSVLRRLR
ncbi:hypothetical protein LCGC14_1488720, partial [marine sediment metagenome]